MSKSNSARRCAHLTSRAGFFAFSSHCNDSWSVSRVKCALKMYGRHVSHPHIMPRASFSRGDQAFSARARVLLLYSITIAAPSLPCRTYFCISDLVDRVPEFKSNANASVLDQIKIDRYIGTCQPESLRNCLI